MAPSIRKHVGNFCFLSVFTLKSFLLVVGASKSFMRPRQALLCTRSLLPGQPIKLNWIWSKGDLCLCQDCEQFSIWLDGFMIAGKVVFWPKIKNQSLSMTTERYLRMWRCQHIKTEIQMWLIRWFYKLPDKSQRLFSFNLLRQTNFSSFFFHLENLCTRQSVEVEKRKAKEKSQIEKSF